MSDSGPALAVRHVNNFDFLRFVGALAVIIGHSQAVVGREQIQIYGMHVSSLGVVIFFAISGYLVTESWLRRPSIGAFLQNRVLRIFPALIVVSTLSAVLFGPLLTSLRLSDYFANPGFSAYFLNIVLNVRYVLPGVFENNIYPHAFNGSLWSLPVECLCYLTFAVVALVSRKFLPIGVLVCAVALVSANSYAPSYAGDRLIYWGTDLFQAAAVSVYFAAGSLIRVFRLPLNAGVGFIALAVALLVSAFMPGQFAAPVLALLLPYGFVAFGHASFPVLRSWGRFGDPSYGMYLISFPVHQTLVWATDGSIGAFATIFWSAVIAIAYGYCSFLLVEKPFLRLKARSPRGVPVVGPASLPRDAAMQSADMSNASTAERTLAAGDTSALR